MIHTDARFSKAVEGAVHALEQRTDAEVVVVAAGRSGSYRDLAFAGASAGTFLFLLAALFAPIEVSPLAVALECLVVWGALAWLLDGPAFVRRLASAARMRRQVKEAAEAEFTREAVHATPRRTGLLVYVSALEGEVLLLPDAGLEAVVPAGTWLAARAEFAHDDLDHFLRGLAHVGTVLAEHVPPGEGEGLELSDAPRVRA